MEPEYEANIEYALSHTELVRPPTQRLNTFGNTNVHYYILTEPMDSVNETRVREGKVTAERPKIVTSDYLLNAFEGFGEDAAAQARTMLSRFEFDPDIMEYKYRNDLGNSWLLSENISDVIIKIASKIDDENDPMGAILKAPDDAWQISLMKFIMDMTRSSLHKNVSELSSRGLFNRVQGIPKFVREEIDDLFRSAEQGQVSVDELGSKLQSYGLFEHYQDRFFALFHQRK
ncbi:MAG: hypothetical protein R6U37_08520 [Dehalococcoidia bacterium]